MFVCRKVSKVYHQNFFHRYTTEAGQNPKKSETLKAYSTKTVGYKLMKITMLRDNVYLVIVSSFHLTLNKEAI